MITSLESGLRPQDVAAWIVDDTSRHLVVLARLDGCNETHQFWIYEMARETTLEAITLGYVDLPLGDCYFSARLTLGSDEVAIRTLWGAMLEVEAGRLSFAAEDRRKWADRFGWDLLRRANG